MKQRKRKPRRRRRTNVGIFSDAAHAKAHADDAPRQTLESLQHKPWGHASSSQIETFRLCARKWWFGAIGGIRDPATPSQELGTRVHKELELYLTQGTPLGPIASAGLPHLPLERVPIGDVEAAFGFDGAVVPVIGVVDLIERVQVRVTDHKTLSDFRYMKTDQELTVNTQGILYTTLLGTQLHGGGETDRVVRVRDVDYPVVTPRQPDRPIRFRHLGYRTSAPYECRVVEAALTPKDREKGLWRLFETVRQMSHAAAEPDPRKVPATLSACAAYGGCPRRTVCGYLDTLKDKDPSPMHNPLARLLGGAPPPQPPPAPPTQLSLLDRLNAAAQQNPPAPPVPAPPPVAAPPPPEPAAAESPAAPAVPPSPPPRAPVSLNPDDGVGYTVPVAPPPPKVATTKASTVEGGVPQHPGLGAFAGRLWPSIKLEEYRELYPLLATATGEAIPGNVAKWQRQPLKDECMRMARALTFGDRDAQPVEVFEPKLTVQEQQAEIAPADHAELRFAVQACVEKQFTRSELTEELAEAFPQIPPGVREAAITKYGYSGGTWLGAPEPGEHPAAPTPPGVRAPAPAAVGCTLCIDCTLINAPVVHLSTFLEPFMREVEKELNISYYAVADYARGAPGVAAALRIALEIGAAKLPPVLVVDSGNLASKAVLEVLIPRAAAVFRALA